MSDCCSGSTKSLSKNHPCPVCCQPCKPISVKTILHHIKAPWLWQETQQDYFFCDSTACDLVYFGADNSLIKRSELRENISIKNKTEQATLCYCFAISYADARSNPEIKHFVEDKTKNKSCTYEVRNPSGKCCLKDFPK